jgi:hypothetical protein
MAKLPYFPFDADEYLRDPKVERLRSWEQYKYLGILQTLWSYLWRNPVKRGHLLEKINGKIQPIPDEVIAKMIHLTPEQWRESRGKLADELCFLKVGKHGELFSPRQSNYKTEWELRHKSTRSERNSNATRTRLNIIRIRRGIELELEVEEEYYGDLVQTFPGLDHEQELLDADAWHKAQPRGKKKKNHHAFFRNWLQRDYKKLQEKSHARSSSSKRYNPSDAEKFGEGGFQQIPKS